MRRANKGALGWGWGGLMKQTDFVGGFQRGQKGLGKVFILLNLKESNENGPPKHSGSPQGP